MRPLDGQSTVTFEPCTSWEVVQSSLPPSPGQGQAVSPGQTRICGSPVAVPTPHSTPQPAVTRVPGGHEKLPAFFQPHSRLSPGTIPWQVSVAPPVLATGMVTGVSTTLLS